MEPPRPSINVYDSLLNGGGYRYRVAMPQKYMHTIQADGGFWSASFSVGGDVLDADEWLEEGLLRHIVVYDDALGVAWEGFVNQVDAGYGPLTVTRGPVLDIVNRADLYYSTVDNTVTPPTVGIRDNVGVADDLASQAIYGIRERILSTGGLPLVNVPPWTCVQGENIRDLYLADRAYPQVTKDWQSQAGKAPTVKVECLGYVHWLDYPYNQAVVGGAVTTTVKILAVIAANPNIGWLPFGTVGVGTPAAPANVDAWENDNNPAWDVIMDAVARGDTTQARWLFGIYANLAAEYAAAPTTVEYHQRLTDPALRVTTPAGTEVPRWSVRPGKWLLFPDLLVARAPAATVVDDPRAMFLESVTFQAPDALAFTGGRLDNLKALLAQLGLSGIGG